MLNEFKELTAKIEKLEQELENAEDNLYAKGREIYDAVTSVPGWEILLKSSYHLKGIKERNHDPKSFWYFLDRKRYCIKGDKFIMYEVYEDGSKEPVFTLDMNQDPKEQVIELVKRDKRNKAEKKRRDEKQKAYEESMRAKFDEENQKLIVMGMTPYPDFKAWLKQQKQ